MTQPLNVAVIGYGFGGRVFQASPISRTDGMHLAAIVSSRSEAIRKVHPNVAIVPSPDDVFADPSIDLVAISTPNDSHFDLAARALASGKHVVVDKPFTVTAAQARELVRRAEQVGRVLSVFHNFRWYSDFLAIKRLIADGTLGEIVYFESHFDRYVPQVPDSWREKPTPAAGTWYDLGPHLVDQVLQLFGSPRALFADLAMQRDGAGSTDYFHVLLRYEKLRVVLVGNSLAPANDLRFVIHGARASFIKYGIDMRDGVDPHPGTLVLADGTSKTLPPEIADDRSFYMAVRDAIAGKGPNPVNPAEAVAVMDVLEIAERSAAQRREVPF